MEPPSTVVVAGVGLLCAVIEAAACTCCAWLALPVSEVLLYEEAPRRYFDGLLPPVDEVDDMPVPDEAAVDAVPILLPPLQPLFFLRSMDAVCCCRLR